MSNAIQFLEALGKDAALSRMPPTEYAAAVAALGMDGAAQKALLDRDTPALNRLLGGRSKIMCLLLPAEDDDQSPDQKREDDEESPDSGDAAARSQARF